jgi:predicted aldo/keto reductase-like oxidoreductase
VLRFVQNSTTPIPARSLGKTGVTLPILGFGTAPTGRRLNTRDAVRLYETAFREGITYFDTAPEFAGYGQAQSQLLMRPSKCARTTFHESGISPEKQVIIESTLRTI